ncbi:hypothetical protein JQC91_02455 [Jannaschia sp. Os4]|uniref:hypothetical protein n=1 Tax=Jannaschia sp. Os4 TaxID=2807617 RepID=UPI00193A924B|nr:hypothetical protein [Jannaschia sp. Os4]MBM2575155.1 hypothetical protein [Jannaschia sp. Os4]
MGWTNGLGWMLAVSVILLGGCEKVMTQLSTSLSSTWGDPMILWVRAGDDQLAQNRVAGRNIGGDLVVGPDGLLHYEAAWLSFDGGAWEARFSIDPARLSTYEGRGEHGEIEVAFGPGADVTVTTAHPELLKERGVAPPSGDYADLVPITLLETCGTPLPEDDPRMAVLRSGLDLDYAVTPALERRDRFLAENPMPEPRCAD